jgi:hypothetical protein
MIENIRIYKLKRKLLKQNQCNETNQSNKSKIRIEFNKMENKGIELKSKAQSINSFYKPVLKISQQSNIRVPKTM